MVYAHLLRDRNDRVVTLFLEEAVTVTETKFLTSTETYSEILDTTEQFESKIPSSEHSDESNEDMYEERSTTGAQDKTSESDHEAQ